MNAPIETFEVQEKCIFELIKCYLRKAELYDTLCVFLLESGFNEVELSPELFYLQKLVLQGRWDDVIQYLEPLRSDVQKNSFRKIEYTLRKQQFLELVSSKNKSILSLVREESDGIGRKYSDTDNIHQYTSFSSNHTTITDEILNIEMNRIGEFLKSIRHLCSNEEYSILCDCLELTSLEDSDDLSISEWDVSRGRVDCFDDIEDILAPLLVESHLNGHRKLRPKLGKDAGNGLYDTIAMSLAYQVLVSSNTNSNDSSNLKDGVTMMAPRNKMPFSAVVKTHWDDHQGLIVVSHSNNNSNVNSSSCRSPRHLCPALKIHPLLREELEALDSRVALREDEEAETRFDEASRPAEICGGESDSRFPGDCLKYQPHPSSQIQTVPPTTTTSTTTAASGVRDPGTGNTLRNIHLASHNHQAASTTNQMNINPNNVNSDEINRNPRDYKVSHISVPPGHNDVRAANHLTSASNVLLPTTTVTAIAIASHVKGAAAGSGHSERTQIPSLRDRRPSGKAEAENGTTGATRSVPPADIAPMSNVTDISRASSRGRGTTSTVTDNPLVEIYEPPRTGRRPSSSTGTTPAAVRSTGFTPAARGTVPPRTGLQRWTPASDDHSSHNNSSNGTINIIPIELFSSTSPIRALLSLRDLPSAPPASRTAAPAAGGMAYRLAIGSNDRTLRTLEVNEQQQQQQSGNSRWEVRIANAYKDIHKGSVYALAWLPYGSSSCGSGSGSGGLLASGSNDKTIRLTRVEPASTATATSSTSSGVLKGHTGTIRCLTFLGSELSQAAATSGPVYLASAGAGDCAVRVWDAGAGTAVACMYPESDHHPSASTSASPVHGLLWLDSNVFLTASEDSVVRAFDGRSGGVAWAVDVTARQTQQLGGCCCMAALQVDREDRLLLGHMGGFVTSFSVSERRILQQTKLHKDEIRNVSITYQPTTHGEHIPFMLTSSSDTTSALWRLPTSEATAMRGAAAAASDRSNGDITLVTTFRGHSDKVLNAQFLGGDGGGIVSCGADGKVLLWSPPP